MKEVIKFKTEHYYELQECEATAHVRSFVSFDQVKALESNAHSYSIYVRGKLIACAGVVEYWKNRGEGWAMIRQNCREDFVLLHRVVKRFLDICPIHRIEATVSKNFEEGHRWVKSLGFKCEAPTLHAYGIDGQDHSLYARVRI